MKKKVLFVATVDSHIELFHLPYLKMFKDRGYEVHVATDSDKKINYCDKKIKLPIKRSPFRFSNLRAIFKLRKIMKAEKYDIVHCHTPMGGVVARLAAKKLRRTGTRVIYTAHGFHFYENAPLLNWVLYYPVEKWLSKYTDTLITINTEDFERAKAKFGKRCLDIQYVPGVGVDAKKFEKKLSDKQKKELRKSLGIKESDRVVICVGRLDKNKNQGFLIKVMRELLWNDDKYHLLLVGPDENKGKYQKLAKRFDISDHIHFLGFRDDIVKLLQISDVAVSASKREGLPVNLVEAAFLGVPIVATECRGNRDVCEFVGGKLAGQGDVLDFAKYVERGINSNRKNNVNEYTVGYVLKDMERIYNKLPSVLIIPSCTDFNRGDQALVLETKRIIDEVYGNSTSCYMMGKKDIEQCEKFGISGFCELLDHPSRKTRKTTNVKYGKALKLKWGLVGFWDFCHSILLLNRFTRPLARKFLTKEKKKSLKLYENADAVFVKGGGFLHDYSGGLIGLYTIYYQLFHIKLALAVNKKVFVMPNSFGPFKNRLAQKMVNAVLDRCEIVMARESISASAKTNGLGKNILSYPDLAFYMDYNNENDKIERIFKQNNINPERDKLVAVTARPYRYADYDQYVKSVCKLISHLQDEKYKVLLVVHTRAESDHEDDEYCINEIFSKLNNTTGVYKIKDDSMNCYDLKKLYGACRYVVGTRFHSVIFSLQQSVPCIAITYGGNKGDGIMHDIGLSKYAIKIDNISSRRLIKTFDQLVDNEDKYKKKISSYIKDTTVKREKMIKLIEGV